MTEQRTRSLVTTRDVLDELDGVLNCVGVAVSAGPLNESQSDGLVTVLRWTTDKLNECSQSLGRIIDPQNEGVEG